MTTQRRLGKSSSISFKTKVDFLYDLERIDKPTYTELLTLMEIRNQFLHNLSAESYSIVLSRLGKEKYIEKFAFNIINSEMSDVSTDKEGIYKYGVNTLYLSILVKLRKALETINDEIEEEKTICYTMKYYSLV
ncbi:MAG: hypothetical protein R2791_16270 [Saprospiraceae bacterium]